MAQPTNIGIHRASGNPIQVSQQRQGTLLPFDSGFSGQTRSGTFLPFDQGFQSQPQQQGLFSPQINQAQPPQNPVGDLIRQLLQRLLPHPQLPQEGSILATDRAIAPKKQKERDPDPSVSQDRFKEFADMFGLSIQPAGSVTGQPTGKFEIQGISPLKSKGGKLKLSDFIFAFQQKQKDLLRRQSDPLNALRATDVVNQVFGERDVSGLVHPGGTNDLDLIRNDNQILKDSFDLSERARLLLG